MASVNGTSFFSLLPLTTKMLIASESESRRGPANVGAEGWSSDAYIDPVEYVF